MFGHQDGQLGRVPRIKGRLGKLSSAIMRVVMSNSFVVILISKKTHKQIIGDIHMQLIALRRKDATLFLETY